MRNHETSDLHMHLNGSYNLAFLQKIAERNGVHEYFDELKQARNHYHSFVQEGSAQTIQEMLVKLIWKQFSVIHKIIQTLADVTDGTINVIESSKAKYMEIRSRPKAMNHSTWEDYVVAFAKGLKAGNEKYDDKTARGILSLDRGHDTKEQAYKVIDKVVAEKNNNGLLVGIDVGGDPLRPRSLTGNDLADTINYALSKNIGVAIHIGEADTLQEKNEIDTVLKVLTAWYNINSNNDKNPLHGKVRLGHGIFLTEEQCDIIKQFRIPMEICPTCHEKVNWWNKENSHPVTRIYQTWNDPVVSGTDDEFIFGANAQDENNRVLTILGYPENQNKTAAKLHHSQFRFS